MSTHCEHSVSFWLSCCHGEEQRERGRGRGEREGEGRGERGRGSTEPCTAPKLYSTVIKLSHKIAIYGSRPGRKRIREWSISRASMSMYIYILTLGTAPVVYQFELHLSIESPLFAVEYIALDHINHTYT